MEDHVHPGDQPDPGAPRTLRRIVADVIQYGSPPEAPEISIVVPLYQQHRARRGAARPVRGRPRAGGGRPRSTCSTRPSRTRRAPQLRRRPVPDLPGPVPGRDARAQRRLRRAPTTRARRLARGRLLLLLNSDVLPDRPGWLSAMRDFYDATPNIGALGPKLLYEDDSIQHAGMYFYQPPGSNGLGRRALTSRACTARCRPPTSPAACRPVSGACMMIDRELYEQFGGLQRHLRAGRLRGLRPLPAAARAGLRELVPARRRALPPRGASRTRRTPRRPANRYNMWLHTHLWGDRIAAIMAGDIQDRA